MATSSKVLSVLGIVIDGTTELSQMDATLDPGGVERTPVEGNGVIIGYREAPKPSVLEFSLSITSAFSADIFRNMTSSQVHCQCDTGQSYVINGAWCAKPPPIGQKEGTAKITINGPAAEEVL